MKKSILTFLTAISIITKTSKSPVYGAIWMDARYTGKKESGQKGDNFCI